MASETNVKSFLTNQNRDSSKAQKWLRHYVLKVETVTKEVLTIEYPLTLEFDVQRKNLATANTANITITNLGPINRQKVYKDSFDISTYLLIELYAGYQNDKITMLPLIFKGFVKSSYTERSGGDFKTHFECQDGAAAQAMGFVSKTNSAGTSLKDTLKDLVKELPKIDGSTIGNISGEISKRANVLFGNPAEHLKTITDSKFYIDNNVCYVLDNDEVLTGEIALISEENGILNSPKRGDVGIDVDMIFEPRLKVGQLLELKSSSNPIYNGTYKVTGLSHHGTISGSVNGPATTTVTLLVATNYKVIPDLNSPTGLAVVRNGFSK